MAQVYSVNAVGYINKTIYPGFNLIANQLIQSNTTLQALIPNPPADTLVYKFTPGSGFQIRQFDATFGWDLDPDLNLTPGSGIFVKNPSNVVGGPAFTITFVGDVPTGSQSVPIVNGLNLIASIIPQAGLISTQLLFPAEADDQVFQFVNTGATLGGFLSTKQYDSGLGWDIDGEPNISVGEAFWLNSAGTHAPWVRTFTVN